MLKNYQLKPEILIIAALASISMVSVSIANGTVAAGCAAPSFTAVDMLRADFHPLSLVVGDFNRDGKADIVTTEASSNRVSVLVGNGDGTFYSLAKYSAGVWPYRIASGDFNDDGRPDLVIANMGAGDPTGRTRTNGGVSVLLGRGDGTFEPAVSYLGPASTSVVVADFNGDDRVDVVMGQYLGASWCSQAGAMVRFKQWPATPWKALPTPQLWAILRRWQP